MDMMNWLYIPNIIFRKKNEKWQINEQGIKTMMDMMNWAKTLKKDTWMELNWIAFTDGYDELTLHTKHYI